MITSKITRKSQTTIPRGVREALEVGPGDELAYEVHAGYAIVRRLSSDGDYDPALGPFLALLARDMRDRPEMLRPVPSALVERIRALIENHDFDPDEAIDGDVALDPGP